MTRQLLNGCKKTLKQTKQQIKICKILRMLSSLEQKCLTRGALLETINNKQLLDLNFYLLNEINNLKSSIKF
jgi:hypothetical protein